MISPERGQIAARRRATRAKIVLFEQAVSARPDLSSVTSRYTEMLRGHGLNKFSLTGTPRERHADTEIKWFQYGMKRADFPFGRRA